MNKTIGKKLKCQNCGHIWTYTGVLNLANCPSCMRKVKAK